MAFNKPGPPPYHLNKGDLEADPYVYFRALVGPDFDEMVERESDELLAGEDDEVSG